MDKFENYEDRKGLWFWMMLSLASVICDEPNLSAKKTDHLVKDFVESEFYQEIINVGKKKKTVWAKW